MNNSLLRMRLWLWVRIVVLQIPSGNFISKISSEALGLIRLHRVLVVCSQIKFNHGNAFKQNLLALEIAKNRVCCRRLKDDEKF